MIAAHHLTVLRGGVPRVRGLDVEIRPGEVTVLVGPNGSGKSTLLAALAGDRIGQSGFVSLNGRPLQAVPRSERARSLAVMPQTPEGALGLSVIEAITLGPELAHGHVDPAQVRRALEVLDLVTLSARPLASLSGGERQRAHLGRVLVQAWQAATPLVVLLDEPLSAQDPGRVAAVLTQVRHLARDGHAVLVVLHDLVAAAAVADRVLLLVDGRLQEDGPPRTVFTPTRLARAYGAPVWVASGPRGLPIPVPHLDLETP